MSEPKWLTTSQVVRMHDEQLAIHGGLPGLRDTGALNSAVARPQNNYEQADLPTLAAAYAYGLAKNHPFADGNKRAALMALIVFLRKNDVAFAPEEMQVAAAMMMVAAGEIDEDGLTRWIRDNWPDGAKIPVAPPGLGR